MHYIKVEKDFLKKHFKFPIHNGFRQIKLELKNNRDYNAVITLSANETIYNEQVDTMDKIEALALSGVIYHINIKTYINRRTPGALKYDDFEFTQCLPKEDSFPILHTLVARIGKMAELLNKKWYGWDH